MPRRVFPAVVLGLLFAATLPAAAQKHYDDPVLERMRKDIFFLASPECEGRGIETKGIEKAANYIADAFKQAGLKPAMANGSYFQPFNFVASARLDQPTKLTLTGPGDAEKELELGLHFNPLGFSPSSKMSGELVFVGYGITAPELKYDDYAGMDVKGKIVVMLRRTPRYGEKGDRRFDKSVQNADESAYAAFPTKIENAAAHKAAGIIMVNDTSAAGTRDLIPQFANHAMGTAPAPFPVMFLRRAALDPVLANGPVKAIADIETLIDKDLKPRSFAIKGWSAEGQVAVNKTEFKCNNVVGVLEGKGPLADETVIIGAHYDHVGYGNFGSLGGKDARGKIHFGADDNASGTTGLIELARRYGAMKDRQGRRLVFIAFSAEERGLYGSIHYCKEPIYPLDKTAAMINMDMIGRSKPVTADWLGLWDKKDRLIVYGTGTGDCFGELVNTCNGKCDFKITCLATGTGPSDHDSFYRKKVPVLFLYTGTHGEYHRPTDVPEKINVPAMKKVADFVQAMADELATNPTKPKYLATRDPWSDPTETRASRPMGPRLGIRPGNYESEEGGVLVDGVSPGGAAEKGGVIDQDVIVEIGGKPVKNIGGYMAAMSTQKAGQPVKVVVLRKGKKVVLTITPE
ncbi:MAG TPA: M28 family peptidase [Gemmata sp.]|nr:M28 family peptidase [Gemmata sp.]